MPYPIIGADLLAFYGLSVDLRGRRLADSCTKVYSCGDVGPALVCGISTIDKSSSYKPIPRTYSNTKEKVSFVK